MVMEVYLLFWIACFFIVHEHWCLKDNTMFEMSLHFTRDKGGLAVCWVENDFRLVKAGGSDITMNYGTDYGIVKGSDRNNTKKGSASVIVRGLGSYGGSKTVRFSIKAKGFWWWE